MEFDLLEEVFVWFCLGSGSNGLFRRKILVFEIKEKNFLSKEKDRRMEDFFEFIEDMEKEISNVLGYGLLDEILSSVFKLWIICGDI